LDLLFLKKNKTNQSERGKTKIEYIYSKVFNLLSREERNLKTNKTIN
jgi:hypothetical protein